MKNLMVVVAATMAFAAFAQEPAAPAADAKAPAAPAPKAMRAQHRPPMMGGGMMDPLARAVMNPRLAEKIGLSDDQKAKLAAFRAAKPMDAELQAKVRAGMEKQVELLKAEKIDEAAVMAAIDEVFEARKAIAKAQTKRTIEIRSILTPEQVAKALEAMKEVRGPRARPNGPRARGPMPEGVKPEAPKCEAPAAAAPVAK